MSEGALSNLNILIIDDDPDSREMLRIILEAADATVVAAKNGREGLDIAASASFDLIISDIAMPGVSGWDFMRMIRSLPNMSHIPIIALTAFSDTYSKRRSEAVGFRHFMTKPVDLQTFVSEVQRVFMDETGHEPSPG